MKDKMNGYWEILRHEEVCQNCIYRVKFNRRSGCKIIGVEKTIGCLDKACDKYENYYLRK